MITHFKLADYDNYFYLQVSSIQQVSGGLKVAGIVGDGSAEAWFEAQIGGELVVNVLSVWDPESETLCQRYDLSILEQGVARSFEEISFQSIRDFDRSSESWHEQIVAVVKPEASPCYPLERSTRPHQWVCESAAFWQQQTACS